MPWFKRTDKGILTPTEAKREVPDGLWFKSPSGKIVHTRELKNNSYVVPEEEYHVKIGSQEYFEILFDNNAFTEMDAKMESMRAMIENDRQVEGCFTSYNHALERSALKKEKYLKEEGILCEVRVMSAHRDPETVRESGRPTMTPPQRVVMSRPVARSSSSYSSYERSSSGTYAGSSK